MSAAVRGRWIGELFGLPVVDPDAMDGDGVRSWVLLLSGFSIGLGGGGGLRGGAGLRENRLKTIVEMKRDCWVENR